MNYAALLSMLLILPACKTDVAYGPIQPSSLQDHCPIDVFEESHLMDTEGVAPTLFTVAAETAGGPAGAEDVLTISDAVITEVVAEHYTLDEEAHPEVYERVESDPRFAGLDPVRDYPSCDHTRWSGHVSFMASVRGETFAVAGTLELPRGEFVPDAPDSPRVCLGERTGLLVPCAFIVGDILWEEYL